MARPGDGDDAGSASDSCSSVTSESTVSSSDFSVVETFTAQDACYDDENDAIKVGCLARNIARRPWRVVGGSCAVLILFLILAGAGLATGIINIDFGNAPLLEDRESDAWKREAMRLAAHEAAADVALDGRVPSGSQGWNALLLVFEVTDEDDNVFTRKHLERIRDLENLVLEDDDWVKYCYTGEEGAPGEEAAVAAGNSADSYTRTPADCAPGFSSGSQFFYLPPNSTAYVGGPTDQTLVSDVSATALRLGTPPSSPEWRPELAAVPAFTIDFDDDDGSARATRAIISFGLPLPGREYDLTTPEGKADVEEQRNEIRAWAERLLWPRFGPNGDASTDDLRVLHIGILTNLEVTNYVFGDLALIGASIAFTFIVLAALSRSCVIAPVAVMQILATFPVALVLLVAFQMRYLGVLNVMCLFVTIAIGADDAFVYLGAWRDAREQMPLATMEKRVAAAMHHAGRAMLVTSASTGAAFLATAVTPLVALISFGAFAALLVAANYALVMTLFPAIIVLVERHSCLCCGSAASDPPDEEQDKDVERAAAAKAAAEAAARKPSKTRRFLRERVGPFVIRWRLVLLNATIFLAIIGFILTTQTKPRAEAFVLLNKGENLRDMEDRLEEFGASEDDAVVHEVFMYFGIEAIDASPEAGADPLTFDGRGVAVFNDEFDLSNPAAQRRLSEACAEPGRRMAAGEDVLELDTTFPPRCFIDSFYAAGNGTIEPFSLNGTAFYSALDTFLTSIEGAPFSNDVGFVDGELRWCRAVFRSQLPLSTTFVTAGDTRDAWYEMMDEFNEDSPAVLGDGFAHDWEWSFYDIARLLVIQVFVGAGASLVVSTIVLLISLQNWALAGLGAATLFCIASVFFGTLSAFQHAPGSDFFAGIGLEEAIIGIIVVGLGVDYGFHYLFAYNEAAKQVDDRRARTVLAIETVTIPVASGALTTIGAVAILAMAKLIYFKKFGALIAVVAGASFLYANCFLLPALATIGPQGNTGDFSPAVRRLWARIRGRRE